MRVTFIARFILCPATPQGKNWNVVDLALQAGQGGTIRPYTLQEDVQCRFNLGDFPRPLTKQDIKHCLTTKKPKALAARFLLPLPKHQGCFSSGKPGARHPREQAV